jgi:hypothetical protein
MLVFVSCASKEERQQKLINKSFNLVAEGQTPKAIKYTKMGISMRLFMPTMKLLN